MTRFVLFTACAVALSVPAFADDSPAEIMGASKGSFTVSQSTMETAYDMLGDDLPPTSEIATRGSYSQGHLQLARNMGVDPSEYSQAELANMFIKAYD